MLVGPGVAAANNDPHRMFLPAESYSSPTWRRIDTESE
jgi:hypothetical protein